MPAYLFYIFIHTFTYMYMMLELYQKKCFLLEMTHFISSYKKG